MIDTPYELLKCLAGYFWVSWEGYAGLLVWLCGFWAHRTAHVASYHRLWAEQNKTANGLATVIAAIPLFILAWSDIAYTGAPPDGCSILSYAPCPSVDLAALATLHSFAFFVIAILSYAIFYLAGRGADDWVAQNS